MTSAFCRQRPRAVWARAWTRPECLFPNVPQMVAIDSGGQLTQPTPGPLSHELQCADLYMGRSANALVGSGTADGNVGWAECGTQNKLSSECKNE